MLLLEDSQATAAATAFKVALAKTGIGLAVIGLGMLITKLIEANNEQKTFNELLEEGTAKALQTEIEKLEKEQENLNKQLENTNRFLMAIAGLAGLDPFTRSAQDIKRDLRKINKDIKILKDGLPNAEARDLAFSFDKARRTLLDKKKELDRIKERMELATEEEKEQFDLETRRSDLIEKYGEDLGQVLFQMEQENDLIQEGIDKLKEEEATKALQKQFEEIGKSVEDGIVSNLADAVEGTKTLAEAAINVLNKLKRKLIEVAIQRAISGFNIGGSIGDFLKDVFKAEEGQLIVEEVI